MKLNVNECKIMHKKENSPNCTYMATSSQIDNITQERDLGVIVKTPWKHHLCGQNSTRMDREQSIVLISCLNLGVFLHISNKCSWITKGIKMDERNN